MSDITVAVLGPGAVGKSAISIQYVQGHFVDSYDATIEDIYRKVVRVDGETSTLTLVDTAGQELFASMRENYMRSAQAFALVFSITDAESLQKLKAIYTHLARVRAGAVGGGGTAESGNHHQQIPCVVIGNKTDLLSQRVVSADQGREFARYAGCHYFEISARDKAQVDEAFTYLVRCARNPNLVAANSRVGLPRARSGTVSSGSGTSSGGTSIISMLSGRGGRGSGCANANNPPRPLGGSGNAGGNYDGFDFDERNPGGAVAVVTATPKRKPAVTRGGFKCTIG